MSGPWVRRVALGAAIAATALSLLWLGIRRVEGRDAREVARTAQVVDPDAARGLAVGDAVGANVEVPLGVPRGIARTFTLARRIEDLPSEIAPVAGIRRGGGMWVMRGAPAPTRPAGETAGWSAGIVLPRNSFAELLPTERAALLELWRAWSGGRAVSTDSVRTAGMRVEVRELEAVLRWQR